ncbi:hypothetical protein J3459_016024 [Metarhizium acridum]|nr:hypothetical protein J3459_016024 [Metarhizium acridum]
MDVHAEYVAAKYWQAAAEELHLQTAGGAVRLEADSEEVHNLGTLEYDSVLKQMWEAVEKWQMETKDLWLWKDGVSVQRFKEMDMRGMEVGFQIGLTLTLIIRDWGMSRRA